MHKQAVINIGMIGHVSNGKTTLTKNLTGILTQKRKDELQANMTIKLGYANTKIFKCDDCDNPECYQSTGSSVMEHMCTNCNGPTKLLTHISITDVPGHNSFMSTMLNGTCVMDKAILVESCGNDENMPAPQTAEHFKITKEIGVETIFACLNKTDLMIKSKQKIPHLMKKIRNFVGKDIPIIPISGSQALNIDVVCEYLANIKFPKKDLSSGFRMTVVRSFNCNSPNTKISELKGGVLGGALSRGTMKLGEDVLVYPGFISKNKNADNDNEPEWSYSPFNCKILSLSSERNSLEYAIPGGFIGVQLDIDPGIACDDTLAGQMIVKKSDNMDHVRVCEALKIKYTNLNNDGVKIKKNDNILISCNSNKLQCSVMKASGENLTLKLEKPLCIELGDKLTVLLSEDNAVNICGYGVIIDCFDCKQ